MSDVLQDDAKYQDLTPTVCEFVPALDLVSEWIATAVCRVS